MKSVLVVGGEPVLQEYLGWVLGAAGYEVLDAHDGACLAGLVESKSIDLIMTDIATLDREGLEAIVDVRRAFPELKIIAITEHFTYQWCIKEFGAERILKKPFDSADLRVMIGSLTECS